MSERDTTHSEPVAEKGEVAIRSAVLDSRALSLAGAAQLPGTLLPR